MRAAQVDAGPHTGEHRAQVPVDDGQYGRHARRICCRAEYVEMVETPRLLRIEVPGGVVGFAARGSGPLVVLLPGCGRPAADLEPLADAIATAGFEAVSLDYRGAGESRGTYPEPTLHAIAADVAAVIDSRGGGPAIVIGHAFGNRVARCLAADSPDRVRALVLLAAGGRVPPAEDVRGVWGLIFSGPRDAPARVQAIADAFFAPGADPEPWLDWCIGSMPGLITAAAITATEDWWTGGRAPMLVVQGALDRTAPPANGAVLEREAPGRVKRVTVPDAGHALLIEQPSAVIAAVLEWLADPTVPAPPSAHRSRGLWPTEAFVGLLERRTAAVDADFLLAHIEPGDRVLDCGCGPGSITRGLAAAAAPGAVAALDLDRSILERARASTERDAIRWVRGSIEHLPFAAGSFDVVFAHTVLMHLDDPLGALRECRRVLAPGGRLGVVDGDWGADIVHPTNPTLDALAAHMTASVRAGGMDPCFGRRLRGLLHAAGFTEIEISTRTEISADPESIASLLAFNVAMLDFAERHGRADAMQAHLARLAWQTWAAHPAATHMRSRVRALGRKAPNPA